MLLIFLIIIKNINTFKIVMIAVYFYVLILLLTEFMIKDHQQMIKFYKC